MTSILGAHQQYFQFLSDGLFRIQRCKVCATNQFPPKGLCTHCGGAQPDWIEPSGTGRIYSASVIARKDENGGDYNVILVDLDEGVRMMSTLIGQPAAQAPAIGARVQALVETTPDNSQARVVFTLAGEAL